jgi:hypothetical protein
MTTWTSVVVVVLGGSGDGLTGVDVLDVDSLLLIRSLIVSLMVQLLMLYRLTHPLLLGLF